MALRGGNALNSGSARKSAKFVKPKLKTGGRTLQKKKMPMKATPVKSADKMKTKTGGLKAAPKKASDKMPKKDSNPTKAGANKAASKMKGGRGRYVGKR